MQLSEDDNLEIEIRKFKEDQSNTDFESGDIQEGVIVPLYLEQHRHVTGS